MSIKTAVAALITVKAAEMDSISEQYAALGEYGASDRADRVRDGLLAAREAYLNTFKPKPEPKPVEPLAPWEIALLDTRTIFRKFLEDAPVGSQLVAQPKSGYTNYTRLENGNWKSDNDTSLNTIGWTTRNFGDEESKYFYMAAAR